MARNILVIDCGSTGIRAIVLNSSGKIVYRDYKKLESLHLTEGATENCPDQIWLLFKSLVKKVLSHPIIRVEAIAITNQRSTFALWDAKTGVHLTNFINWQDVRSADTAKKMNKSLKWRVLKGFAFVIGRVIRNPLLIVTSMLNLTTDHTICKLRWLLDKDENLNKKCLNNSVKFGTIDTWLLYKLTGNKVHATDYTNAAATTLLNPFMLKWNKLFCNLFKIPMSILPKVMDSNSTFGYTDSYIFGKEIPVMSIIGDQQASLFGHRCFTPGDAKITLGSGGFISMNVGYKPKFSLKGLFPLVAWTLNSIPEYSLEGQVATVGTYIDWAVKNMEFFKSPQDLDQCAEKSVENNGIIVMPTLTGLRFPYFKPKLTSSINGLTLNSTKNGLANAILEGIAHRVIDIVDGMEKDTKIKIKSLKIDGGVSNSDVLMQIIANLSGRTVYRSTEQDLASTGAGYLAGLSLGIWESKKDILKLSIPNKRFLPIMTPEVRIKKRTDWINSCRNLI